MIKVSRESWHTRIYLWWYWQKYHLHKQGSTNLCPYMRTIIFWAPIRAIFWDWIKAFSIPLWDGDKLQISLNALTIPSLLFTFAKLIGYHAFVPKLVFLIFTMAVIFSFAIFGLLEVVHSFSQYKRRIGRSKRPNYPSFYPTPVSPKLPGRLERSFKAVYGWGFWALLREYLKSAHDNVCPPVEIDQEKP